VSSPVVRRSPHPPSLTYTAGSCENRGMQRRAALAVVAEWNGVSDALLAGRAHAAGLFIQQLQARVPREMRPWRTHNQLRSAFHIGVPFCESITSLGMSRSSQRGIPAAIDRGLSTSLLNFRFE